MHPIAYAIMTFGAILSLMGIVLFAKKGSRGSNTVKMLGFEFQLMGSSLVIFVVGSVIFMFPILYGEKLPKHTVTKPSLSEIKPSANSLTSESNSQEDINVQLVTPQFKESPATEKREPRYQEHPYSFWFEMLEDKWWETRKEACLAMYHFGSDASTAVPKLISILETDIPKVSAEAALALSRIGESAKSAIPSLKKAMSWAETNQYTELKLSVLEALIALEN